MHNIIARKIKVEKNDFISASPSPAVLVFFFAQKPVTTGFYRFYFSFPTTRKGANIKRLRQEGREGKMKGKTQVGWQWHTAPNFMQCEDETARRRVRN